MERALAPVAVGLTYAAGIALVGSTEKGWAAYMITAVATLVLTVTDLNPMFILAGGGLFALIAR